MKRVFNREFVVYPNQNKFVIFNYLSEKGKKNSGRTTMYVRTFYPSRSSWNRIEKLTWRKGYTAELAMDEQGEQRFVFTAGESLS